MAVPLLASGITLFFGVAFLFVGIILSVVGDVRAPEKKFQISPLNSFSASVLGTALTATGYLIVFGGAMVAMLVQGLGAVMGS